MSNLYQDAILDAKALRASAMANAKAALEEAFEPKIQEMMRQKLTEELEEVEDLEEEMDENINEDAMEDGSYAAQEEGVEENLDINEAELEEILSQLEEITSESEMEYESLNEAEEDDDAEKTEDDDSEESDDETAEGGAEVSDETKVIEITVGDLKEILQSVMAGQQSDLGTDEIPSDDADAEAEVSLDEILAELEAEGMEADIHNVSQPNYKAGVQHPGIEQEAKDMEMESELEEAKATIETLRQGLQEVNLLNAKYLYMNKLFKSKSLTESQKVKVINALDRASSVKEVKNTYETLKESFVPTKKTQLKESIGFASQSAGIAPKKPIIEQDNMLSRWQKLAGIK
jgi:hypothetical protein